MTNPEDMTQDELSETLKNLLLSRYQYSLEIEGLKSTLKDLDKQIAEVNRAFEAMYDPSAACYTLD